MTDTPRRFVGPILLTTSEQTLYTVPAGSTAILLRIRIANTSGTAATAKLSIGADAAGTRLLGDKSIAANDVYVESTYVVLAAGETLRGQAGTTNVLNVTVGGVEVT